MTIAFAASKRVRREGTWSLLAQPLLFETNARNPALLGGVALVLVVTAVVASGIPALRARRIDPMTALRDE
jgi:hypothetical protein